MSLIATKPASNHTVFTSVFEIKSVASLWFVKPQPLLSVGNGVGRGVGRCVGRGNVGTRDGTRVGAFVGETEMEGAEVGEEERGVNRTPHFTQDVSDD